MWNFFCGLAIGLVVGPILFVVVMNYVGSKIM